LPISVVLALAVFPLSDWVIWDLARTWIWHGGERLPSTWPPATDEEKIAASRIEAVVLLFFYALIVSGILLLIRQQPISPEQLGFRADRWAAGLIFGVLVGMAWVSIPPCWLP
jgi:hypothetical protein